MITMTGFAPSKYQQAIYDFVQRGIKKDGRWYGNAVVIAAAGSGKSTTLQQLLNYIPTAASVLYVAFNSDASKELRNKL